MRNVASRPRAVVLCSLTIATLVSAGCKDDSPKPVPPPMAPETASGARDLGAAPPPAPATNVSVSGTVAETLDAPNYTYIRITTASGDKWAAVPQVKLAVGDPVTLQNAMVMTQFASPTLKRTFDEILFGTLVGRPGAGPATAAASSPQSTQPTGPIAKAAGDGGHTVAEIFAGKAALKDKPVTVRGRVTKYNAGILGHNWVHIADGSGSKAKADDDLAVTTQGEAAVGDVVVVHGVVHLDRDFGSGYAYPVLVEEATMER